MSSSQFSSQNLMHLRTRRLGRRRVASRPMAALLGAALVLAACGTDGGTSTPAPTPLPTPVPAPQDAPGSLVVYSGRNENLVADTIERFTATTGIAVEVRYGDTAELAIQILEEGDRSPADVYWGQDAGALGALEAAGRFSVLPDDILGLVDSRYRSRDGRWTGITGRSRNLVVNTDLVDLADVPASIFGLVDPRWSGRIGWAPENGSFQAFVTAMRVVHGEGETRAWLEAMIANDVTAYRNNTTIVEAIGRGEIAIGLVNNYYLPRFTTEDPNFPAVNVYLPGDVGGIVNVAGAGILATTSRPDAAAMFIRFMLSEEVQSAFGSRVDAAEFPLRIGIDSILLPTLESLGAPDVDLSRLDDLQGTLALLQEVGAFDS
jgi:iron(III) transport system substrate-binding protein